MIDYQSIIDKYGWAAVGVFATEEEPGPTFTYTIGLNDRGWAELILVGIPMPTAHPIIGNLIDYLEATKTEPKIGDIFTEIANLPIRLGHVSQFNVMEYLTQAYYRAQHRNTLPVRAIQLLWPDREGHFPDDPKFDHTMIDSQPILAFDEPHKVPTTKQ